MWIHPRTNSKTFYIAEQVDAKTGINNFRKNKCIFVLVKCYGSFIKFIEMYK